MKEYLRTYCEIDLDAIYQNMKNIKEKTGNAMTMAVIKADGYGHGATEIAHYIDELADYYGVATIEEGISLREDGITKPMLILGYTSPSQASLNAKYKIEQAVYSYETAKKMSDEAVRVNGVCKIHIAVDTGMTRIGISPDEKGLEIIQKIRELPNIIIQGMFTHFSCADMTDQSYTTAQMERYDHLVSLLENAGIEIPVKHICNSAGIMEFDHHRYEMCRAGIILYGLYPSEEVHKENLSLTPALSWRSHVVNIMEPEMGRGISYGATYVVDHPCKIATVSIGYADGYPRSLSNKGWVLIHGKKAKIVGRVCMDQMMVDISDIEGVRLEDVVTLVGRDGEERISVEEIADLAGSFNYEFTCDISKRVPRIYLHQ